MADKGDQRRDYNTELQYEKNYRTHQKECGVRTELWQLETKY